jgi:hypothetical protein
MPIKRKHRVYEPAKAYERKKPTRKRALKCGAVHGPLIPRGWACCACYREHGVGVYNRAELRACHACGHTRCVGAMKRAWPDTQIAVPEGIVRDVVEASKKTADAEDDGFFGGLLRAIGAFAGKSAPRPPPRPQDDPKWQAACNEVVAAFAAAQLRAEHAGHGPKGPTTELMVKSVKDNLPRAVEIFAGHPNDAPPCKCRHYSLIAAGAEKIAAMTGQDFEYIVKSGTRIIDWYLAGLS